MLLKINNGKKEFSGETLFENVDFEVKGTEKIAIVGRNGCGKTTLARIFGNKINNIFNNFPIKSIKKNNSFTNVLSFFTIIFS